MVMCFGQPLANFLFRGCLEAECWAWHGGQLWTAIGGELLPAHLLERLVEGYVQRLQFWCAASRNQSYTRMVLWEKADDLFGTVSSKCVHDKKFLLRFGVIKVDLFDPAFHKGGIHPSFWLNTDNPTTKRRENIVKPSMEMNYCESAVVLHIIIQCNLT